jgi:hypothetical protein
MSERIFIQYVDFEPRTLVRQYTFKVLESGDAREFTLTITNEAFESHRARYQDGPDICTLRLRRELSSSDNRPAATHFRISEADLEDYRAAHLPKSLKNLYGPRPKVNL